MKMQSPDMLFKPESSILDAFFELPFLGKSWHKVLNVEKILVAEGFSPLIRQHHSEEWTSDLVVEGHQLAMAYFARNSKESDSFSLAGLGWEIGRAADARGVADLIGSEFERLKMHWGSCCGQFDHRQAWLADATLGSSELCGYWVQPRAENNGRVFDHLDDYSKALSSCETCVGFVASAQWSPLNGGLSGEWIATAYVSC